MEYVKIRFPLEAHEEGFPPIAVEMLNAQLVNEGVAKIDNTPFFVESIAIGDIVLCKPAGSEGVYDFERVVEHGNSKSVSIIFIDESCKEDLYQYFKVHNCYCEYGEFGAFNMLAVSIPASVEYPKISKHLEKLEAVTKISFAELCL
ncbi:DUF4265 domain-containing protein [Sulfidibacter corallicola]|uniref:DUF4265 domain-containing protein n=1 Tax=Sulfidibacter corallicola TaxID=2818388 RepID=A0A8A4TVK6_SULCO|nr:DUF4265 domain-containing protein [Sulfidibacter corallicola]QTD50565.1 DUF4265 domain-containing protein [Sulfidibacter corallicola]